MNSFVNMSLNILLKVHFDGGGKFESQKNKQKFVDDHHQVQEEEKILKPNFYRNKQIAVALHVICKLQIEYLNRFHNLRNMKLVANG